MMSQRQTCLKSGLTRWSGGSGFGTRRPTAHLMQTVKAAQRRAAGAALADPTPRGFRGLGYSVAEGTANFVANRRMNNSQQIRWSRSGAFHRRTPAILAECRTGYGI